MPMLGEVSSDFLTTQASSGCQVRDHLVYFEEELQHPTMELEGNGLPSEISMQLDGEEVSLDGNGGKSNGNLESQSKEKGQEERIWEILKANRLKRQYI